MIPDYSTEEVRGTDRETQRERKRVERIPIEQGEITIHGPCQRGLFGIINRPR